MNQTSHLPAKAPALTSGQLGSATGLSRGAIRLYEKYGLITPERRTSAGYRVFSADTVVTLNAIKVACKAGFTLAEVGDLLGLIDAEPFSSAAMKQAIKLKIAEVDEKIDHLNQFKRFMQRVSKNPEMLLDPACDAMLELAMLAANPSQTVSTNKSNTTALPQRKQK
jgi:MerR family transcriptional regulator, copper efflux regulator